MRLLIATWILFRAHLGAIVFSMRSLISLGLVAAPVSCALLLAWLSQGRTAPPTLEIAWFMHVQCAVPLVALVLGSAVVAEDVDERTITYLLTRPIPRSAILLGRLVAVLLVMAVGAAGGKDRLGWLVVDKLTLLEGGAIFSHSPKRPRSATDSPRIRLPTML